MSSMTSFAEDVKLRTAECDVEPSPIQSTSERNDANATTTATLTALSSSKFSVDSTATSHPSMAQLSNNPHQPLRRSASLRLRGTTSNLAEMGEKLTSNVNGYTPAGHSVTLGIPRAGPFSERRKLELTPANSVVRKSRSLSLPKHSFFQHRTDSAPVDGVQRRNQVEWKVAVYPNAVNPNTAMDPPPAMVTSAMADKKKSMNHIDAASTALARPVTLGKIAANGVPVSSARAKGSPISPHTPGIAGPQYIVHQKTQSLATVPENKLTPKTPPVTPDSPSAYLEDDLDSLFSYATTTSGRSTMSCEHPYVARNGTTFSGRKMKYVVHCSNYAGQIGADYLTPTQRAQRQIRRLKDLLCAARQDLEQKDSEILRLTREVVELRLFKASLSSPEERSASSDAVTVREAELKTSQDVSPIVDMVDDGSKSSPRHIIGATQNHRRHSQQLSSEMQSSFADSGHFEDLTSSSVHSKDSFAVHAMHDMACGSDEAVSEEARAIDNYEVQRRELICMYEQRIEDLIRSQDSATSDIKRAHNDKVEALLQKLADCNTRYADVVPGYEHAKERIRELEKQLEDLQHKLAEHEDKQNKMYLHMYQKGQEAERIARADQALALAHRAPNKVTINELLCQLQSTQDELENIRAAEYKNECGNHVLLTAKEAISLWVLGARKTIYRRLLEAQKNRTHVDPEVTLQFLKSAVYYFLTDKENSQNHLQAIESILEFTEAEKQNINKAYSPK